MSERVLVAMSGGVDSSVAALVLRDAGYEVVGVTLRLWGGESDTGCCSVSDVDDARRVAQQLDIDHHVFNFSDEFTRHVVEPYVADHSAGRTPNPCIECNRHLKFDLLMQRAEVLGFDLVATGHHARVVHNAEGSHHIGRGADAAKDQSYVLSMLTQDVLERLVLPVGELTKPQVREVAERHGLRTAAKPDSQDVCFITSTEGRRGFLERRVELHPGRLVDTDGHAVGSVSAVELVTPGQRRGLGLAGGGAHRYALDVDVASRTVTVGTAEQLEVSSTALTSVVFAAEPISGAVLAQTSAHGTPRAAVLDRVDDDGTTELRWDEPVRRVAPGQTVALYDPETGSLVVAGAVVAR